MRGVNVFYTQIRPVGQIQQLGIFYVSLLSQRRFSGNQNSYSFKLKLVQFLSNVGRDGISSVFFSTFYAIGSLGF
jgi:hypothetical protein